jgi:hypothetical protein
MNTKELEDILNAVLAADGFRRRKDTWYRSNEDTISLVNLQKSEFGGRFYINLAVYLRDLGTATSPSEYQSHIRVRLSAIAGKEASEVERALDLERPDMTTARRSEVLSRALTLIALPFLAERSVLPRLRELHSTAQLGPVLLTKATRELLEAPSA